MNQVSIAVTWLTTSYKRPLPFLQTFATLSPIPGFMKWLLAKLATQCKLIEESKDQSEIHKLREDLLLPEEEKKLEACRFALP
jgi:malonyl-CoA decarboxylase